MRNNNLSLLSGRVKKVASTNADANRYSYLDLKNAEPDTGVPSAHSSLRGLFGSDINGTRQWFYADAGLTVDTVTGQIIVNEDTVAIDTSAFTNSTSNNLADVLADFDQSLQSLGNSSLTTVSTDDTILGAGTSGSPLSIGQKVFHDSKPEFAGLAITPNSINISGISLANPLVITTTGSHGLTNGKLITIEDITGTTQLNGNSYYVDVLSVSTIALYSDQSLSTSINGTTGFSAYTSDGRVLSGAYRLPESDGTDGTYLKTNGFGLLEFDRPSAYQGSAPANPDSGDLWYDSVTALDLLIYTGSAWVSATTGGAQAAFVLRQFVGDGTTTVFQTNAPGVQKVLVFLNGILLRLTDDFTLNSSTGAITFLSAPGSSDTIEVILTGDADLVGLELLGIENHDLITVDSSGNVTLQGELDMASNKIVNVTDPTSAQDAATKAYVDSVVTAADLDFTGDTGTGAVDLDSQTLAISGTANEIVTTASGQTITLGLPSTITVDVTGNLTGNVTGTVSSIANHSTTDLTEGTNLYYTDARADARITAADTDDLSEGTTNLYYTNARADARIAAASITDLSDADQTVRTTDNVTFGNITSTGYIAGPAVFTIDPAGVGDNTGKVVIAGDLQVDGTTTTINSTTVSVDDLNLTLASGAASASAANGAGITIDGASATFTYVSASDRWTMNKDLAADLVGNVTGNVTGSAGTVTSLSNRSVGDFPDVDITTAAPTSGQALIWDNANSKFIPGDSFSQSDFDSAFTAKDTDDLSEGTTNLYFTNARADARIAAATTTDLTEGTNLYYTDARADARIAAADTDDLSEGTTNLYYTDARADARITAADTDDLSEGTTNLYYTDARFDTRFTSKSTTNLSEGTNLYFTNARADARIALQVGANLDLSSKSTTDLSEGTNLYYTDARFDTRFTSKSTTNLSEGTNLYFTNARADARIAAASIDDLTDVDITTAAPTNNQVLVWDNANSKFIPGDAAADFTDLTGQIAASQIPNSIITSAMLDPANVFSQEFTANGSTTAFTLSTDPGSKNAIQVFIDGVPQRASNYTVVGTTLTLGGTPVNGQLIEVRGYGIGIAVGTVADDSITGPKLQDGTITADKISSAAYASETFTGNNSTTAFTLSTAPGAAQSLLVMVENVIQEPIENYTTSGTTLTFTGTPALNARIYVRYLGLPLANALIDNSVTNATLNLTYTSNQYTGDNTTTAYTIASGHTINSVLVVLDGLILPPADYSVSGTTLTFASAPLTSQSIDIRYMPV